jgi:hypothetical protein
VSTDGRYLQTPKTLIHHQVASKASTIGGSRACQIDHPWPTAAHICKLTRCIHHVGGQAWRCCGAAACLSRSLAPSCDGANPLETSPSTCASAKAPTTQLSTRALLLSSRVTRLLKAWCQALQASTRYHWVTDSVLGYVAATASADASHNCDVVARTYKVLWPELIQITITEWQPDGVVAKEPAGQQKQGCGSMRRRLQGC